MTDVTFAGVALSSVVPEAIVLKVTRQLVGERRQVRESVPGRSGSWTYAEQPGDRLITIDLNLQGEAGVDMTRQEARRAAVVALAEWADSTGLAELVIDDEDDRYWLAMLDDAPSPDEWIDAADVSLVFRAGPYAWAADPTVVDLTTADAVAQTFTVDDTVDALPVVEVGGGDFASGFTLTVNGLALVYGTPVDNPDVVTVTSLAFVVMTGANTDDDLTDYGPGHFDADRLSMADVDGDFPVLIPGTNHLVLEGGNGTVMVTWRRRYR